MMLPPGLDRRPRGLKPRAVPAKPAFAGWALSVQLENWRPCCLLQIRPQSREDLEQRRVRFPQPIDLQPEAGEHFALEHTVTRPAGIGW